MEPSAVAANPLGHFRHCGEPGPGAHVEIGHRWHLAGAAKTVELGADGPKYVPAAHASQTALVVAPTTGLALPGAQGSQCIAAPLPLRKSAVESGAGVSHRPAPHAKQAPAAIPEI